MTRSQLARLRPGDYVTWAGEGDKVDGEVLGYRDGYLTVKWDDDATPQVISVRYREGREFSKYIEILR